MKTFMVMVVFLAACGGEAVPTGDAGNTGGSKGSTGVSTTGASTSGSGTGTTTSSSSGGTTGSCTIPVQEGAACDPTPSCGCVPPYSCVQVSGSLNYTCEHITAGTTTGDPGTTSSSSSGSSTTSGSSSSSGSGSTASGTSGSSSSTSSSGTSSGGTTGGSVGDQCSQNSDCTSNYCPPSKDICECNVGGMGYVCQTDSDCCSPATCSAGVCVSPSTSSGTTSSGSTGGSTTSGSSGASTSGSTSGGTSGGSTTGGTGGSPQACTYEVSGSQTPTCPNGTSCTASNEGCPVCEPDLNPSQGIADCGGVGESCCMTPNAGVNSGCSWNWEFQCSTGFCDIGNTWTCIQ